MPPLKALRKETPPAPSNRLQVKQEDTQSCFSQTLEGRCRGGDKEYQAKGRINYEIEFVEHFTPGCGQA
ncbi:hypothetical protein KSB_84120 [Ktedonobacter robiniae]|uniref:Uncharacterized protein n=1 Tax=Ktedonobacter robiniae TaxID=2778365 RepID=A0ABQ3V5S9_9CHLR|nr:hypothetical protein KSB_84120 [Ktedonobacter robiniae]